MFGTNRRRRLEMIQAIRPTSKAALKVQCLWASGGDVCKAKELYDFFVCDMPDLPDNDPVQPTWVDNTKDTLNGLLGWMKENQQTFADWYGLVSSAIRRRGLPAVDAASPLPPINE